MAELLFIATTIFVAYVLFEVVGGKKGTSETDQPDANPVSPPAPEAVTESVLPAAEAVKPVKPVSKEPATKPKTTATAETKAAKASPAKPRKTPAKKAAAPVTTDSLKNPKTGEVAKIPGNYAFAKRWIKEALVEEGLLDKIYKNNELDTDTKAKIDQAVEQLKAMEKYH